MLRADTRPVARRMMVVDFILGILKSKRLAVLVALFRWSGSLRAYNVKTGVKSGKRMELGRAQLQSSQYVFVRVSSEEESQPLERMKEKKRKEDAWKNADEEGWAAFGGSVKETIYSRVRRVQARPHTSLQSMLPVAPMPGTRKQV